MKAQGCTDLRPHCRLRFRIYIARRLITYDQSRPRGGDGECLDRNASVIPLKVCKGGTAQVGPWHQMRVLQPELEGRR
eukprot:4089969-Pleurochrysis_carterae.AAC.1